MYTLKNVRMIDPKSSTDTITNITINEDLIYKIGEIPAESEIIDCSGLIVGPGLIDVHVHFRDPGQTYKEDIITGANAAKHGGFTTVIMMANTKPVIDNVETLKYVLEKGKQTGIHVLSCASITKDMKQQELVDMESLLKEGAAGFTDDGLPILDEKLLKQAMEKAVELHTVLSFHEEDPLFIKQPGVNMGKVSKALNYGGASATAEDVMVARDSIIALDTGARISIQHLSSKNSVALIRTIKALGADLHAEATPHHFSLTEDIVLEKGTYARMNPPLRTKEDQEAIIEGLKDGTIDIIVTDHAPHSTEEKAKPMDKAPSGIIGLETSLALGITNLVHKGHLSMLQLLEKMTINPARFYNLETGYIEEGNKADLVVFDENEKWVVQKFASKASNSPFTGMTLEGKVKYTICEGKIVYQDK